MICHFVELTNFFNWGKFMVCRFDKEEWSRQSRIDGRGLIGGRGWSPKHLWIMDLQTGEGAMFLPGGSASYDLNKHAIWVCPMFEVFLKWLYKHPEHWDDLTTLPPYLELTDPETLAESAIAGSRRPGPDPAARQTQAEETQCSIP